MNVSLVNHFADRLQYVRQFTLGLLQDLPEADWYRQPTEGVTCIAWQAGHIAWAEYGIIFMRALAPEQAPAGLLPEDYASRFGSKSTPSSDRADYPRPTELLDVMQRVHEAALSALSKLDDSILENPVEPSHPLFKTKKQALQFCPEHEWMHAGQIVLLRRLLGHAYRR